MKDAHTHTHIKREVIESDLASRQSELFRIKSL